MMHNYQKLLLLLAFAGLATGCSVEGQVTDLSIRTVIVKAGQAMGIVSSSTQMETTSGGYKVSSSAGHSTTGVYQTTSGGYKVYSTVQGNNASESVTIVVQ